MRMDFLRSKMEVNQRDTLINNDFKKIWLERMMSFFESPGLLRLKFF